MSTLPQTLAEKCVTTHVVNGQPAIRLRTRDAVAVISSPHGSAHGVPGTELECVRAAIAGYVQEGIEEGRRQAGEYLDATTPVKQIQGIIGGDPSWSYCLARVRALVAKDQCGAFAPTPEALAAAREEGRRAGWAEAMGAAAGYVAAQVTKAEKVQRQLQQEQDGLRIAKALRDALSEAAPEDGR